VKEMIRRDASPRKDTASGVGYGCCEPGPVPHPRQNPQQQSDYRGRAIRRELQPPPRPAGPPIPSGCGARRASGARPAALSRPCPSIQNARATYCVCAPRKGGRPTPGIGPQGFTAALCEACWRRGRPPATGGSSRPGSRQLPQHPRPRVSPRGHILQHDIARPHAHDLPATPGTAPSAFRCALPWIRAHECPLWRERLEKQKMVWSRAHGMCPVISEQSQLMARRKVYGKPLDGLEGPSRVESQKRDGRSI
jgi:hypothetical protein